MKSAKMKIVPADIVKQVWQVLRALAKATPDIKADVSRVKDVVFDLLKKKKRYGGIAVHSRSLLHIPQSFSKVKKAWSSNYDIPTRCSCASVPDLGIPRCSTCNNNNNNIYTKNAQFFEGGLVLYESMDGSVASNSVHDQQPDMLSVSNFLQRIDEEARVNSASGITHLEEIDQLADDFIASFHEKFRLEKQQSYRRYQDMLARST